MLTLSRCHALFKVHRSQLYWRIGHHTAPTNEQVNIDGHVYFSKLIVFYMQNKAFPKHPVIEVLPSGNYRMRIQHKEKRIDIGTFTPVEAAFIQELCNSETITEALAD